MWDAIVVGARCAGSALALLLSRRGAKVLLLDKASFPSDTLSTHFLWPRGASYLNRWGMLEPVLAQTPSGTELTFARDGIAFPAKTPLHFVEKRLAEVHSSSSGAVETYVSVRRIVLDQLLLDAAIAAGATFRSGVSVKGLLRDGDRVVGIRTESGEERAGVVVGADGRASTVARAVDARIYEERAEATFAYWSYISGLAMTHAVMEKRGRLAVVIVPTNFSASMTLVFGPKEWWPLFRQNKDENFYRAISFINHELGEVVRGAKREERFYGIADQRGFKRRAAGPGWLLLGDAACIKDQCTAIGMTHAFRDAELAEAAILSQEREQAFEDYCRKREADLEGYYDFVCRSAGMAPASADDMRFMEGLRSSRDDADGFAAMYGDSMRVSTFANEVRPRVLANSPACGAVPSPDGAAVLTD